MTALTNQQKRITKGKINTQMYVREANDLE